jgi:hypothetical protein
VPTDSEPDHASTELVQPRKLPVWLGVLMLLGLAGVGGYLASQGLRPGLPVIMSAVVFLSPMIFAPVVIAGMMGKDPKPVMYWIGGAVAICGLLAKGCSGN